MARAVVRQTLFALLLLALPVAATGSPAGRVIEPRDGTTLIGGASAVIRWTGPIDEDGIEEWEAFLSVDGGRYYSVRITPHLDVAIREFRWTVPNVASRDVRILLRFGNEKNERVLELPLALAIEPTPLREAETRVVSEPGESARPGDPGVTQWAEGDRTGSRVTLVAFSIPGFSAAVPLEPVERSAIESSVSALICDHLPASIAMTRRRRGARPAALLATDILLQGCRLNI